LLFTELSEQTVQALGELLQNEEVSTARRAQVLEMLDYAFKWKPELIDFCRLLPVLQSPAMRGERETILPGIVERLLFAAPAEVTPAHLESLLALYSDTPDFRYFLFYLAGRTTAREDMRAMARSAMSGKFPLHESIRGLLGSGSKRILVVKNLADGQGDETLRVVPLIEALLAFNSELVVSLITNRGYLYDHSRVLVTSVRDRDACRALLSQHWDGLIHLRYNGKTRLPPNPELDAALHSIPNVSRLALFVSRAFPSERCGVERLGVDGRSWLAPLGLNRHRGNSVYELTFRLIAELGLPLRAGEERDEAQSVLASAPNSAAEECWTRLTSPNSGAQLRPIAVVNPFGGGAKLKGFVDDNMEDLAFQLRGLVREGYFLTVLPNGPPWAREAVARQVVGMLDAACRAHIAIGPDPSAGGWTVDAEGRTHRTSVMRMFKYFVSWADLVVTVEGWLTHMAYSLGKPTRVFLAPQSGLFGFLPHGRTRHQNAISRFSPEAPQLRPPDVGSPLLLGQPLKQQFMCLLSEVAAVPDDRSFPVTFRALSSPDPELRELCAHLMLQADKRVSRDADVDALRLEMTRLRATLGACNARATECEESLRTIMARVLTRPELVDRSIVDACESLLVQPDLSPYMSRSLIATLLAVLYALPGLLSPTTISGARALLASARLPRASHRLATELVRLLHSSPLPTESADASSHAARGTRDLLILILQELVSSPDSRVLPFIHRALTHSDAGVRGRAARALAVLDEQDTTDDLLALLCDPAGNVRGVAAEALLGRADLHGQTLPVPREHLQALTAMHPARLDWGLVESLGDAARPALTLALRDEVGCVKYGARKALAEWSV
jgi:hypothetical protein